MKAAGPNDARRISLKNGPNRKKILLVAPPFPEVGDTIEIDGTTWTVTNFKFERIIARFEFTCTGRLRRK